MNIFVSGSTRLVAATGFYVSDRDYFSREAMLLRLTVLNWEGRFVSLHMRQQPHDKPLDVKTVWPEYRVPGDPERMGGHCSPGALTRTWP